MKKIRDLFVLDEGWIFLNHGSFGACPKPVFEAYQAWQLLLERQPVEFLYRNYHPFLDKARQDLAAYLGTQRDGLVFVHNATTAVNIVLNSIPFKEGDEILTTDWEYGACVRACQSACDKSGVQLVMAAINPSSKQTIVDSIMAGVTDKTKLLMVSEITSANAFLLPIPELIAAAKAKNILILVDGAHVPGQNPLHLDSLGADFYTGNCHKWMMAPKGCAFLYVKPELQSIIQPLVISWGWGEECEHTLENSFVSYLQYSGTNDPSAWLAISESIQFMQEHDWDKVRQDCKILVDINRKRFDNLFGQGSAYAYEEAVPNQLFCSILPPDTNLDALRAYLLERKIEMPLTELNGQKMIRVSVQGYITQSDLDTLYETLQEFMKKSV